MDYGKLYYNISTVCFSYAQVEFDDFKNDYIKRYGPPVEQRSLLYLGYGSNMQFYLNSFHDLNLKRVVAIVSDEEELRKSVKLKDDWNNIPHRKKINYDVRFVVLDFENEISEEDVQRLGKFDIVVSLWSVYWGHENAIIMKDNVFKLLMPNATGFILFHSCNELFEIYYLLASEKYINYLGVVLDAMKSYRGLRGRGKAITLFALHDESVTVTSNIDDIPFNQRHIVERMVSRCGGTTVKNLLREDLKKMQNQARNRSNEEGESSTSEEFDYLFNVTTEIIKFHYGVKKTK